MAGSIQSDINQALGTTGVLAQLSPQLKELAESKKLARQSKVADRAIQQAKKGIDIDEPMIADNDVYIDALQNKEDIAKKQFELNPTNKSYGKYSEAFTKRQMASLDLKDARDNWERDVQRQLEAMEKAKGLQEAKKTQKRNFMDYLAKQPTSLGGTVGDLPKDLQKKIASQYSEKDRKRIMNQMDREAANGKSN